MSHLPFQAKPMSRANIRRHAEAFRERLGLADEPWFPVIEVLEKVLDHQLGFISFQIGCRIEMGAAEGETAITGDLIRLREDVYERACNGSGRDRFTAAHEAGHWDLHTDNTLKRLQSTQTVKKYCDPEWQANTFASELLMPFKFIDWFDTPESLIERHGVSTQAAEIRLGQWQKEISL